MRRNRRVSKAFQVEREALRALTPRRTTDYTEEDALVSRNGTFTVHSILYSAPSRLTGHRLKVRLYRDRLECFVAGTQVLEMPRSQRGPGTSRGRVIDYRNFIENSRRKPQAFAGYHFRDVLSARNLSPDVGRTEPASASAPSLQEHGHAARSDCARRRRGRSGKPA